MLIEIAKMYGNLLFVYGVCLIVLVATVVVTDAHTVGQRKREWPITLCTDNEDCDGGCCKGLFCFRYLGEGERCLFGHHLKVGCGCEGSLECALDNFSYKCVKPEATEIIDNIPEVVQKLDRELQALLPNEAIGSDNEAVVAAVVARENNKREISLNDDVIQSKSDEIFTKEKRDIDENNVLQDVASQ